MAGEAILVDQGAMRGDWRRRRLGTHRDGGRSMQRKQGDPRGEARAEQSSPGKGPPADTLDALAEVCHQSAAHNANSGGGDPGLYSPGPSVTFSSRFPMRTLIASLAVAIAVASAACGPQTGSLQAATDSLGAAQVNSVEFSGTGRWYQFGQAPAPGTPWP